MAHEAYQRYIFIIKNTVMFLECDYRPVLD
jgi:hypothetical protein